jgi:tetraacyldisaccharide-1-P 4'-kinase
MEIGEKFTFYSNERKMKALFLEKNNEKIKCVICDDKMQGVQIEIHESQIVSDNQISMF